MRNIILLTDQQGEKKAYGSIRALLEDPDNTIQVSEQYLYRLAKGGWPVKYRNYLIEKVPVLSAPEARSKETATRIL